MESFVYYRNVLTELAVSSFAWKGLPETVDPLFLEKTLFYKGSILYFNDDIIGDLALPFKKGGALNVYNIPTDLEAYAANGYHARRKLNNSVIIWNNYLRTPTSMAIDMYAMRLSECTRIIDVNIKAQKTPVIVWATEEQRLTMLNLYEKYDGNQPYIFGDKGKFMEGNEIGVLKTDAPYNADKISATKREIWEEALTFLGHANISTQKKERMITDEVQKTVGGAYAMRSTRLVPRQIAAKQISEMFGREITVEFREDINYNFETGELEKLEVRDSEQIYD